MKLQIYSLHLHFSVTQLSATLHPRPFLFAPGVNGCQKFKSQQGESGSFSEQTKVIKSTERGRTVLIR